MLPSIGILSGFYFYIYAPMQIPVGVLTDRYGARKLLSIAALIAGIGMILFSITSNYWMAALGRCLMGGGSAFGFVGLVYICSHWFPEGKRGTLMGLGSSIGILGAVMGMGPLSQFIQAFGWRIANFQLGLLGLLIALVLFIVVRNDPPEMRHYDKKMKKNPEPVLQHLLIVFKCRFTWLISIVSFFIYITIPGFAGLWGVPFLHSTYGISVDLAGYAVSMIFIGWAVGGPLIGIYSDKIQKKKKFLLAASLLGVLFMSMAIYIPNIPIYLFFPLFFLVGFISGTQLLTYSYAIDINEDKVKGVATAFTNFCVMLGGALIQPFIGFLLDHFWTGQESNGVRVYSPETYKWAMTCFPLAFLLSFIFTLFLKQPKPKGA
jgi:MFS family permease